MTSKEIENNVVRLIENFSQEEFIYDLLLAYGISKTSITRLKKGDFNLSKNEGEVLYKKKIFFKEENADKLLSTIEQVAKDESITRHQPRFAIVTDYNTIVAKDLKLNKLPLDIKLKELPKYFDFFLPLAGAEAYHNANDNEADRNAAYKMGELYNLLVQENHNIHDSVESLHNLNLFLSRLLFCFFAEDTGIFKEESIFTKTLVQHTDPSGKDAHLFLNDLFKRLNSEEKSLFPDYLARFEYVNGGLFKVLIESPKFTSRAFKTLVALGELQWKNINPDIFGSMIQAVVIPGYRSNLGMHYTSVENIKKLIKPLFLDELEAEFEKRKNSIPQLRKLINRMSKIMFFDPACGSGNFLIITYKEIRLLEIKILERIIDLSPNPELQWTSIHLTQFFGIEIDDFAHEMAILSLLLAEHQMDRVFEDRLFDYGRSKDILPLKEAGKVVRGNATRLDWKDVCPVSEKDEVYLFGNPPYLGSRNQKQVQKDDLTSVFKTNYKSLDYISAWFYKGAKYIEGYNAKCAFVSTNSICQGDQVALTWPRVLSEKIEIAFAYQSFKWTNNAKGNAGVTVIIVGLRNSSNAPKYLFYDKIQKEAKNINPYLLDSANIIITGRSKPLSKFPEMKYGNMPNDGGNLILNDEEKTQLTNDLPIANRWIKDFIGASEFIRGFKRYCLWISDKDLKEACQTPSIKARLENVVRHREKSSEKSTRAKAETPNHFYFSAHVKTDSILIPRHSSETREYIPIGFFNDDTIIADSAMAIYHAQPWLFAVITSRMHMVWVRAVGGKLKTDYRYSAKLCYNTFPFPDISTKQKETLNLYVFTVLDERAKHPEKTMAQLYNPATMPKGLKQAHQELDEAVEKCYRLQPFKNDTERLEYLFKQYEEMIKADTLFAKQKKTRKKKAK